MVKIEPMLLTETYDKKVLEDDSKWFQVKENGTRAIVHIIDGKIAGIRNRSNHPVLFQFPELKKAEFPFKSAVLDGEICVFNNNKSVFYGGVDKRRSDPTKEVMEQYPVTLVLFDALKVEDEVLIMKPYKERYNKLLSIKESDKVWVAKNLEGPWLWNEVIEKNLEGVVIKNPMASYELGKRSLNYIKMKNYKITELLVERTEGNDKGTKVFGTTTIDGKQIHVEAQLGGVFDVPLKTIVSIKYLDICGDRLIQPTKVSRQQMEGDINGTKISDNNQRGG